MARMRTIDEVYGSAFAGVEAFEAELDRGLDPPSPDQLFDIVAGLGLPAGSRVLDVGARDGRHCLELARRFGFRVHGVEPVRHHLAQAARAVADAAPELRALVDVTEGVAQRLPEPDGGVDLVWCRDVLVHVADLTAAYREFRRVLRPGGHAVIHHMTATDLLTEAEAAALWPPIAVHPASTDPAHVDACIAASGLRVLRCVELHGAWRERLEEDGVGRTSRQLLWASRLLRNREDYRSRYGADAYEAELSDCLWGVYQMIGKLNPKLYVLAR
jgi:sarcosine/dimethylglycine N-methyltransferase